MRHIDTLSISYGVLFSNCLSANFMLKSSLSTNTVHATWKSEFCFLRVGNIIEKHVCILIRCICGFISFLWTSSVELIIQAEEK